MAKVKTFRLPNGSLVHINPEYVCCAYEVPDGTTKSEVSVEIYFPWGKLEHKLIGEQAQAFLSELAKLGTT